MLPLVPHKTSMFERICPSDLKTTEEDFPDTNSWPEAREYLGSKDLRVNLKLLYFQEPKMHGKISS